MKPLQVSEQEFHTILAALRFYQQEGQGEPANRSDAIHDLATNNDDVISLDSDAIDQLCERINMGAEHDNHPTGENMADRMTAQIAIGGPIPARLVEGLLEAIRSEDIELTWDDERFQAKSTTDLLAAAQDHYGPCPLRLMDHEAIYGKLERLESFLEEHKIAYDRWTLAEYGYDSVLAQYRPGMQEPVERMTSQDGELAVPAKEVQMVLDALNAGELEPARSLLSIALGPSIAPLQPFTIEERKEPHGHVACDHLQQ